MRWLVLSVAIVGMAIGWSVPSFTVAEEATTKAAANSAALDSERRLGDSVRYLASDELEGRGVGTKGLNQAADYIAAEFTKMGLNTKLYNGTPFQKFKMVTGAEMGATNKVALVGPPGPDGSPSRRIELKLGVDFNPLAIGGSGKFDVPVVFAGYGITSKDDHYDDYAGLDVKGKAVIVMRHEPQQWNPYSSFNGTKPSVYAPFTRKLSNASEHEASLIVFCTDDYEIEEKIAQRRKQWQEAIDKLTAQATEFKKIEKPTKEQTEEDQKKSAELIKQIEELQGKILAEYDPVFGFTKAGPGGEAVRLPALHCRRSVLDDVVQASLGKSLAQLEAEIDKAPKPASAELKGWRLVGEITVHRTEAEVKNVVGVLEGEGPLADETVVIGAHYDHLGYGGEGSFVPDKKEIHNGADDNASGASALIEVARLLTASGKKPARRIVFIAFTGEERGLIGSARYCKEPLYPLASTVAMLNMDMVGRLTDDKLIIQGTDTAPEFVTLIDELNKKYGFKVTKQAGGHGPSDHSSFYTQKIPVMHFFTGTHKDYHRPSDDADKINVPGMRRVAEMVADAALQIADTKARPTYKEVKRAAMAGGGGDRPYFGSIPDFAQEQPGYALSGVTSGSPAEKAGLKGGDTIIKLGDSRIANLEDFDSALRKYKPGDKVPVTVKRDGKDVTVTVTLDPPR
jgi:hypothetical protein